MSAPLVGITGRRLSASVIAGMDARFGGRHIDMFFSDYARCIAAAGGIPVELPFETAATAVVERLDALVVTGGQDVHPAAWGGNLDVVDDAADPRADYSVHDRERDAYETALVRAAVDCGIPLLAVCRGIQLLNVAFGGTLVADLPQGPVEHLVTGGALHDGAPDHVVTLEPGSLAEAVFGPRLQVNSWHHQAVDRCAGALTVSGRASDGVVETVEIADRQVLGLQWHPEWQSAPDLAFTWLTGAAATAMTVSSRA
ncbi:gamma-glutamyl-gamma-aminobutyrate hydrolase family protein [Nakamurella endophytica]|uniref:Peptidase C26 n=1 Tax=Nakamurella endophytica TaxID=1748367 RepID=A0A917WHK7_9ACTN|nr:gamma-glutamyl-gamma-aminobutyrate hydrolase family protein [Nakamurella endophytica]GGM04600.1 peptidase C26 [Nakamurella endophytica]